MELREELVAFLTENQEKFYRLAFSYVHSKDGALDAIQNAIVRALQHYQDLRNEAYLKTWFYRILVNECCTYLRKSGRERLYEPEVLQWKQDRQQEQQDPEWESDLEVYERVIELPEEKRTVVLLRFYEGLSLQEISKVTNTSLSTVKYRLYAALKQLKRSLTEVSQ